MKELSLNVLDITKNSVKAGATLIDISLVEVGSLLTMTITDNGCGMKPEVVETVMNPFYTTRTTRKVGMGVPLLMLAAEQTGGGVTIESRHEEAHPEDPDFSCVELRDMDKREAYLANIPHLRDKTFVCGSDAHYLWDVAEAVNWLEIPDEPYSAALVRNNLIALLRRGL